MKSSPTTNFEQCTKLSWAIFIYRVMYLALFSINFKFKIMKIEVKDLMSDNEMLSHIFLGCIPYDKLKEIKDKFIGEKDWKNESVKLLVELKIAGVSVNPKQFFDSWKNQMEQMILDEAKELVAEKLGSQKMRDMQDKLYEYKQVLKSWENDINWEVKKSINRRRSVTIGYNSI